MRNEQINIALPEVGASSWGSRETLESVWPQARALRLVTFIDSTTLLLLLGANRRQHAQGGQLLVLVGPTTPMTAFEATRVDRPSNHATGRRTKKQRCKAR